MTCDTWHMRYDTWHVTSGGGDHLLRVGVEHVLKSLAP